MKKTNYILSSSAVALALLIAAPALAHDGIAKAEGGFDLNLGSIKKAIFQDGGDDDRDQSRKDAHATTTVNVHGTVTAIDGTTLTLSGKNGAVFTVNAGGADDLDEIAVGDNVVVKGSLSGSVIIARDVDEKEKKDHDKDKKDIRAKLNATRVGLVTAVGGNTFTIDPLGKRATTTVMTNASTTFKVLGGATTTGALQAGAIVVVKGTTSTTTPDTITASVVHIVSNAWNFLKFLFR